MASSMRWENNTFVVSYLRFIWYLHVLMAVNILLTEVNRTAKIQPSIPIGVIR